MFPLGSMTKDRVREIAAERGFAVAAKPDSHDICFIPDGDTRGFLARRLGSLPGPVVDAATGETVGEHDGTYGFTVGQRRGSGSRSGTSGRATSSASSRSAGRSRSARRTWPGSARCAPASPRGPVRRRRCRSPPQVQLRAHATPVACEVRAGDGRRTVDQPRRGAARRGSGAVRGALRAGRRCVATGCSGRLRYRRRVNVRKRFVTDSWFRRRQGLVSVTSRFLSVNN